jgi:beta-xylosidase
MFGCYTFPRHVGLHHPGNPIGVDVITLLAALKERLPYTKIVHARGCDVREPGTDDIAEAVAAARRAEVCVAVVGDRAGLFDVGTSGEGCDAADLDLPGEQAGLLDAVLATGTPVVIVVMSGRPYALGRFASRAVAIVQAFFPGQEGGRALASVLTGEVCPSGRMPVSMPREGGSQPWTYLVPKLGHASDVSNIDPTPLYPFGHGLSYTSFDWQVSVDGHEMRTDEGFSFSVDVRNTGELAGADVVQVYLHDPVASVTRPPVRLVGYARVEVEPGRAKRVTFDFHADLCSFTGLDGHRVVEPGLLELRVSRSSEDVRHVISVDMVGGRRIVGHDRRMTMGATVADV